MGKECPICHEEYDEKERCPRSLPCSHTLCSECIGNLISRNSRTCPFCIRQFNARSVRNIGINTELVEVLQILKETELKANTPHQASASSLGHIDEVKRETQTVTNELLVECQKADIEIDRQLHSIKQLLHVFSKAAEVLNSTVLANITEMWKQNVDRVTYLKQHSKRLESQKVILNEKRNQILTSKTKAGSAETFTQVGVVADEVGCMKTDLQKTLGSFMEQVSEEENTQLKLKKVAKTTIERIELLENIVSSTVKDDSFSFVPDIKDMAIQENIPHQVRVAETTNVRIEILENIVDSAVNSFSFLTIQDSFPHQVTMETLRSRSEPVLDLMRQRKIFTYMDHQGNRRYAQLSLEDNQMYLHCLREQILPSGAYILQHRDVMSLVDPSFRTVYMDIGTNESTFGRILISLTPDTKRANNFFLLSSGESGPSYLNTILLGVFNKDELGEFIEGGDYEYNTGGGGKGVVEGAGEEEGGVLKLPFLAGSVSGSNGDKYAALFCITTRDNPKCSDDRVFGQVESGLNSLREAIANYPNIKDVRIIDCGIVLDI